MHTTKSVVVLCLLVLNAVFPLGGLAQTHHEGQGDMSAAMGAAMTDGEVRKVDAQAGKITIKHGDIEHMNMPGMTMVFTVKNKNLLSQVKSGDKIRFMVAMENGKMVITDIQPAP